MTILETRGIEVEVTTKTSDQVSQALRELELPSGFFSLTHDASCESHGSVLKNGLVLFSHRVPGRSVTVGTEIVTRPFYNDEWRYVGQILSKLANIGEPERTQRGSIHVHIGFPDYWPAIRNVLTLVKKTESLWFHLGGMGYKFRGLSNKSIYCRPLTGNGAPVIPSTDGGLYKLFEFEDLLKAGSASEFWNLFGINRHDPNRYHPARYFFINIYSILLHGTLELRVMNRTFSRERVQAVADLFTDFATLALHGLTEQLEDSMENSYVTDPLDSHLLLDSFFKVIEASQRMYSKPSAINVLHGILDTTPYPVIDDGLVLTHVPNFQLPPQYLHGKKVPKKDVAEAGNMTIHNIGGNFLQIKDIM